MGYLFAFITVFLWSLNIVLAKYFASNIEPIQLASARWIVATIIILPFTAKELWRLRKLIYKNFLYLTTLSLLGIVLANTLIYFASRDLSATNVALMQITSPLIITILSALVLKQDINLKQFVGLLIAVTGVFEVLLKGDWHQLLSLQFSKGDVYMLFYAISFALYTIFQRYRPKEFSQSGFLAITIIIGATILLPTAYFSEGIPALATKDVELILYLGIFNSILSFLAWNIALSKLGDIKTSMFLYLMPFITSILGYFMLQETITHAEIIGGMLIIVGILIINFMAKKIR